MISVACAEIALHLDSGIVVQFYDGIALISRLFRVVISERINVVKVSRINVSGDVVAIEA